VSKFFLPMAELHPTRPPRPARSQTRIGSRNDLPQSFRKKWLRESRVYGVTQSESFRPVKAIGLAGSGSVTEYFQTFDTGKIPVIPGDDGHIIGQSRRRDPQIIRADHPTVPLKLPKRASE